MTEQEQYLKFWQTFTEKAIDIQKEYSELSDANKRRAESAAQCALRLHGIAGLFELVKNPPRF